jgi:predicted nucleic acid-binding protein
MTSAQKKALIVHRHRQKRRGFTRLEVTVRKADATLIRDIARALADPAREAGARAALRQQFGGGSKGLKSLLAAAPLEGVDLTRERDLGRDIELRKAERCDRNVAAWFASIDDDELYLSVLVLGEIRRGVERTRSGNPAQARALDRWLSEVNKSFAGRILPVDQATADEWGQMTARRTAPVIDALLAATAKAHGMTLVTRNVRDVRGLGADVLDPFEWRS